MNFNDFKNLVMSRQSCRGFTDKEIPKEDLEKICSLARYAPSACNSQPWKLYCVSGEQERQKIAEFLQKNTRNGFTSSAKAFIVISELPAVLKKDVQQAYSPTHFTKYDIGEMTAYITLTAKSLGIDSCIIGWVDRQGIKEYLNFSSEEECYIVVALGYSNAPLRDKVRKDEKEFIKYL